MAEITSANFRAFYDLGLSDLPFTCSLQVKLVNSAEGEKIFLNMLTSCLEKHPTKWPLYLEEVTLTSNRTLMERSTEVVTFELGQRRVEGFHLCRFLCVKEGECRANLSSREGEAAGPSS